MKEGLEMSFLEKAAKVTAKAMETSVKAALYLAEQAPATGNSQMRRMDEYARKNPNLSREQRDRIAEKKSQIEQGINSSYDVQAAASELLQKLRDREK